MRKILSLVLAVLMVASLCSVSFAEGELTPVGTPRAETLIVETQTPTDLPGIFNPYMMGVQMGFGIHQLITGHLWEMDTVSGNQFGEIADGMPESNEDFTEHIVHIRQGINWSDGEPLTADDVVFTMNTIMTNTNIGDNAYYNTVFESIEKVDDYTVQIKTKESFPRLSMKFGVTIWGCGLYILPEHVYSQFEDITTFEDNAPVTCGPYVVDSYDPNGQWVLYKLRDDWKQSTLGVVTGDKYTDIAAKYVWCRALGDDTTRQMSMINNEVDILCEVTPEILDVMTAANDKIACWYNEFPYATSDDPCSKGLAFSIGKGEPYSNPDFRWAIALMMNFDEISLSIFDGTGRASALPCITATKAGQDLYYKPLVEWLEGIELDLGDGTTTKVWDSEYANRMCEYFGFTDMTDEEKIDMFGVGCWKYNPEAAEKLLIKAGLEKKDDGWYFNGEKFTFELSYLADTEAQAGRGVTAAYDQMLKFGLEPNLVSKSSATWDTDGSTGNYDIAGYWPTGFITKDVYSQISGYDGDLINEVGQTSSGQGTRWYNAEATEIIHELSKLSPDSEEAYQLGLEFLKIAVMDMPFIGFHSGVKFVPTNSTYWTNYPSASNPYNGPWWWWSCFKYIVPEIQPVA